MAKGTYNELQCSGLDIVSLLKSEEEQERLSGSADRDKLSLHSQRTNCSHGSHCSYSSLLPPEGNCADQLPVGTFSRSINQNYIATVKITAQVVHLFFYYKGILNIFPFIYLSFSLV